MNKRAMIEKAGIMIFLAIALLLVITFSSSLEAGKSAQTYDGNLTCEIKQDATSDLGIVATKDTGAWSTDVNWTIGNICPGPKICDIYSIFGFARYINAGSMNEALAGEGYFLLANSTESNTPTNGTRYLSYLNQTLEISQTLGPRWECGIGTSPTTCNTANQGFNESGRGYIVTLYAYADGFKTQVIADVFNINYTWCWTPIIHDAYVSAESATWEESLTFTINVTNPDANTTVKLWTRKIGATWTEETPNKSCENCSAQSPHDDSLSWVVSFVEADVGNWEFKFNATDDTGYSTEANVTASASSTNECVDGGNDCAFQINIVAAVEGAPDTENTTVNGVQTDAAAGWGETWNFTINASDSENNPFNMSLQVYTDSGWQTFENETCLTSCDTWGIYNFSISNFTCSNITTSGQYRFFLIDNESNSTTTTAYDFDIEQNDIELQLSAGNNSIANRSGDQLDELILRIFDQDNATYPENVNITFKVKFDAANYDAGTNVSTNSTGYSAYNFNASCSPTKYTVGDRDWKGEVTGAECYKTTASEEFNLSTRGDITLLFDEPTTANKTQEDTISFLGSTWDDCGDSLGSANVTYYANASSSSFACSDTSLIGANAFRCNYVTDLTTPEGWYNLTLNSNATYHYDNHTNNTGSPGGYFYLLPKYELSSPTAYPTTQGWGNPNWQFNVTASSGDANNIINVTLYMGTGVNPTTVCNATYSCYNQTPLNCSTCSGQSMYWERNFTYEDQGQWFYQFKMDNPGTTESTSGTTNYITVDKDNVNITYGGAGNESNVTRNQTSQLLVARVYDKDKDSYNVTGPNATVVFKLLHVDYPDNDEKIIGISTTNSTGHAVLNFSFEVCEGWVGGDQLWKAEINGSEENYNTNSSDGNYTIELVKQGCTTEIDVYPAAGVLVPTQAFENNNFSVNATITSWQAKSQDSWTIANTTEPSTAASWIIYNQSQYLGNVTQGAYDKITWNVTPTTVGSGFKMNVFANSSNGGNDSLNSSGTFTVYKEYPSTAPEELIAPKSITPNNSLDLTWPSCDIGNYRVASITTKRIAIHIPHSK